MVDLWGPRQVYPAAVGLWSLAGVLTGFAVTVRMLSGFRFMLGVGEAYNWPAALKVTQSLLPPKDRALANGIFNSGAAAGAMIAPIVVTFVTVYFGWRAAFVITGLLGGGWVLAWFRFVRPFRQRLVGSQSFSFSNLMRIFGRILSLRDFWLLAVSAIFINSVNYFLADWIPLYLKTERGFTFAVGNVLSILVYGSLEAGNILIGFFIKKMVEAGYTVETSRKWALLAACLLMSAAAVVGLTPSDYLAVCCLMLTALGVASFLVIYLTVVQDLDPQNVGASAGLLGGLGNLAYGFFSPHIGRLSDLGRTSLTFALVGALPWLAFAAIYFGVNLRER
jgi:ACS family hexuronate transporter-like MFS transporter